MTFYDLALTSNIPVIGLAHVEYSLPSMFECFEQARANFNSRRSHQSPKDEYAENEQFDFDLTCDVIGDPEVNVMMFRSTDYQKLFVF